MSDLGKCERLGCSEDAVAFDDNGRALCEDCIAEWEIEYETEELDPDRLREDRDERNKLTKEHPDDE